MLTWNDPNFRVSIQCAAVKTCILLIKDPVQIWFRSASRSWIVPIETTKGNSFPRTSRTPGPTNGSAFVK